MNVNTPTVLQSLQEDVTFTASPVFHRSSHSYQGWASLKPRQVKQPLFKLRWSTIASEIMRQSTILHHVIHM